MLTRNLLTRGSETYYGLDLKTKGFSKIISMDSPIDRIPTENKTINTTVYAELAEQKIKEDKENPEKNKNRKRFAGFINGGY